MPLGEDGSKACRHHWEMNRFPNGPAVTFYWIYPVLVLRAVFWQNFHLITCLDFISSRPPTFSMHRYRS